MAAIIMRVLLVSHMITYASNDSSNTLNSNNNGNDIHVCNNHASNAHYNNNNR